jgi:hypothetical protein
MSDASPKNSAGLHTVMVAFILSATISCIYPGGEEHTRAASERRVATATSTLNTGQDRHITMVAASETLPMTAAGPISPLIRSVLLDLTVLAILLFLLRSIVLHPLRQLHSALPQVEEDAPGSSHQ